MSIEGESALDYGKVSISLEHYEWVHIAYLLGGTPALRQRIVRELGEHRARWEWTAKFEDISSRVRKWESDRSLGYYALEDNVITKKLRIYHDYSDDDNPDYLTEWLTVEEMRAWVEAHENEYLTAGR